MMAWLQAPRNMLVSNAKVIQSPPCRRVPFGLCGDTARIGRRLLLLERATARSLPMPLGRCHGLYSTLFDSMIVDCLERIGVGRELFYTAAMLALSLGFCLNGLSVVDLLLALGLLSHPYGKGNVLHPQHSVWSVMLRFHRKHGIGAYQVQSRLAMLSHDARIAKPAKCSAEFHFHSPSGSRIRSEFRGAVFRFGDFGLYSTWMSR